MKAAADAALHKLSSRGAAASSAAQSATASAASNSFAITVQCCEVYNDEIHDLLEPAQTNLYVCDARGRFRLLSLSLSPVVSNIFRVSSCASKFVIDCLVFDSCVCSAFVDSLCLRSAVLATLAAPHTHTDSHSLTHTHSLTLSQIEATEHGTRVANLSRAAVHDDATFVRVFSRAAANRTRLVTDFGPMAARAGAWRGDFCFVLLSFFLSRRRLSEMQWTFGSTSLDCVGRGPVFDSLVYFQTQQR